MPPKKKSSGRPTTPPKQDKMSLATTPEVVEVTAITDRITDRPIVEEMHQAYLDYAMSVIVMRALPDVRDGLKPVHRRILYTMWTMGLRHSAKFKKSAAVVGEVLGKYHPHGDSAVYESMVRMAQDFSMRYPLVNGQGNFGSMDGDGAAAMRYTEAKLAGIAEEMLVDIEKDTVEWRPNYDGSHQEPKVLPAKLPNLLLMGSVGIAVGMATNIPPHNLREIIDGVSLLIDNPECTVDDLIKVVKGPDFPTGGIIFNKEDIKLAYATGRGGIVLRAQAEIVEDKAGAMTILVTEMPYQVNKSTLIEQMANLVKEKKIEGIKDIRDESSRKGVRVVIELKRDSYPKKILNQLFKQTQLQETFHVNMLALADGLQPQVMPLKTILEHYINHRLVVVRNRTQYELTKAMDRAHILEGLQMALLHIDKIIETIKKSRDKEQAKEELMKKFKLSDRQAVAILDMRLQQLAGLERLRVEQELKEKTALIKELEGILKSPAKMKTIIKTELTDIRDKYGDERRTEIVPHPVDKFKAEDLIPDDEVVVMMTRDGYIKRLDPDTFKSQGRGGKGIVGATTKEEDVVEQFFTTSTHADLLFFTNRGRVFQLKGYDLPVASRTAKGQAIVNFLQLGPAESVTTILPLSMVKGAKFILMVTSQGNIKKTAIEDFANVRRSGLIAIKLKDADRLQWVKTTTGKDNIILSTKKGQAIRFEEKDVRPMGRAASGVRGIKIRNQDYVVGMDIMDPKDEKTAQVLTVMTNGFGKRTAIEEYKVQGRGGSGIKTAKVGVKTGEIVGAFVTQGDKGDLLVMSAKGQVIRLPLESISELGRDTQGVRIMRFKAVGDQVASVTMLSEEDQKRQEELL